jgi:hypothetical protein
MQRRTLFAVPVVVGSLLVGGCDPGTAPTNPSVRALMAEGASPSTDVVTIPVGFTIQPSGKAAIQACVGETVTFAGDAMLVAHQTILPDGSVSLDLLHFSAQGAIAIGATTGTVYRLGGGDSNPIIMPPSGLLTATFVANLPVIGPGGAANFTAHILQHITITPNGDITALVDIFDATCR